MWASVNGGGAQRITYQGSYNTAPAFSPDCKKIAYESREGGIFQIYVIDAGGGDPKELTPVGSNESPAWSPDGRYIIFASEERRQLTALPDAGRRRKRYRAINGRRRQ